MADHIAASIRREAKETRYRTYVTEALRILTENTTHYLIPGVGNVDYGAYLTKPWNDQQNTRDSRKKEPENGDQIALDLMRRAGLTFGEQTDGSSI